MSQWLCNLKEDVTNSGPEILFVLILLALCALIFIPLAAA